ncbi:hypothetical protein MBLNU230_g0778t1 [Neophaeotheca triangularis]
MASNAAPASTAPLLYAPWTSDVELAFYSTLASLKINHDKLDSSARKCLGLYQINHKDAPERSARMEIHGTALTTDEYVRLPLHSRRAKYISLASRSPGGYYRAEGIIRNFNTAEEFKSVDKAAFIEQAGRTIWDAINDGTIYSCPSLLASFAAICFADLKKYKFNYHFAFPALHSDPVWRLVAPDGDASKSVKQLKPKETTALVDKVQTWRYSVDTRQHGFFLAKRIRQEFMSTHNIHEDDDVDDGNMHEHKMRPRTPSVSDLGFMWVVGSLASYESGFFDDIEEGDRYLGFADPSTYAQNPGWMLRNLLVLVRQRWKLDNVQVLCYRDTHARREHPTSLVMNLQSAEPVFGDKTVKESKDLPIMSGSSALRSGDVDASGDLIPHQPTPSQPQSERKQSEPRQSKIPPLPKITGWERNENGKLISRTVDLAAYLDPKRLADQAVDLNLKLIKWRISPSIDLETIKHTKCLLLGAGTLGTYVARGLMGWGVRKITFVDNGKVSYSNPVRQPLYDFKDCMDGGVNKAERAAEALEEIYPGIKAEGHTLSVPQAGHQITDEKRAEADFNKLKALINTHDAIFLLMDTRESRWLPTLMAKAAGKIAINAALGFDTYVVMRHGLRASQPSSTTKPIKARSAEGTVTTHPASEPDPLAAAASDPVEAPSSPQEFTSNRDQNSYEDLGCYFCNDVVAPGDSLRSATLDQQCTVTRPGIAPLASALAVELLVSLTQHPLKARAPAPTPPASTAIAPAPPTNPSEPDSHPLGTVPHQLRGYLSTWQTLQVRGRAYDCCAACSEGVLAAYEQDGWEFVKKAVGEKGFVEKVSGLAEVQRRAEEALAGMDEEGSEVWGEEDEEGEGELV